MFRVILLFSSILPLCFIQVISETTVCIEPDEFEQNCVDKLGGVLVGPQCYFYGNATATWEGSWAVCLGFNATLAQIFTAEELSIISDYSLRLGLYAPWFGLRRVENSTTEYAISPGSYWYLDVDTPITELDATTTYIGRSHPQDDDDSYGHGCFQLWWENDSLVIYDDNCIHEYEALCQITNSYQTFTYIAGFCLTDTVVMIYNGLIDSECATQCATTHWCRSFNFYTTGECQLFTFYYADTTAKGPVANCFHYSIKP